ncbi:hypothetical protein TPY_3107 [Sulfobacillus acidophilus TPY]|uniref:Death-on-curing family protein n=1 Tax=Sulfobacillus acidophilus (strain ATCC 700253 / DSM 10332 / NAL) TaxID=679936 RepID=G8U159_SULAD|nr:hypothetical protein TPY_3107 [Sulfobacillus acidophilus TPY]AEW04292.1 death-on-curing family protein [Sulfobacillus acidophilus DSM 10332]
MEFQRRIIVATGGVPGVLNPAQLEAALARPFQSVFGRDVFPHPAAKVAALMHGLITTHPFVDGNKRTALRLGLAMLQEIAQRTTPISQDDVEALALGMARGQLTIDDVTAWIFAHYQF